MLQVDSNQIMALSLLKAIMHVHARLQSKIFFFKKLTKLCLRWIFPRGSIAWSRLSEN